MNTRSDRFSIILVTIVVALVLTLLPLPPMLDIMQPYWVALVIIYWGLETQNLISLGLAFTIGVRTVGIDDDGEPRTVAICEEVEAGKMRISCPKLPPSAAAALDVLRELSGGTKSVLESDWRKAAVDGRQVSGSDKVDSRHKAFKRAMEELTRNHVVAFADDKFTEIRQPGEDFTDDLPEI